MKNHVMNLVNFVRGCEPRKKEWDLYTPVVREIEINKANGFQSTFLLQYDAMIREDLRDVFLRERDASMELGVWLEMGRPLTEAVGIEWRGRPGFDWDWYVNPGFLMAYTPTEREAIIDEVFRLFREIFGEYPKVAGSWLLDAHSMSYMSDRYGMDAFVICREQYAVDAYTLWGGYYSGGYYPSRNNMLCPAQHKELQINTPVFRMLGIDPIYGYDEEKQDPSLGGCYTMEPFWPSGSSREVMDWYFRTYYNNPSLSGSYATTGQENSFDWKKVEESYIMQIELLRKYVEAGKVRVETLGETGRAFRKKFPQTPASVLSAFEDWSNQGIQSVWYSCRNWRANLFLKDGTLIFRDMQKFDDRYKESHWDTPCTAWQAFYENLPLVDNRLWSKDGNSAELRFCNRAEEIVSCEELSEHAMRLKLRFADGRIGTADFDENSLTLTDCGEMHWSFGTSDVLKEICGNELHFAYRGNGYRIELSADVRQTDSALKLTPSKQDGKILFFFPISSFY